MTRPVGATGATIIELEVRDLNNRFRPRPHLLGWGETAPALSFAGACPLCGKVGSHDVIMLSRIETFEIVYRTHPTLAVELRP